MSRASPGPRRVGCTSATMCGSIISWRRCAPNPRLSEANSDSQQHTVAFRSARQIDRIHMGAGVQPRCKVGFGAKRSALVLLRELRQTVAGVVLARATHHNLIRIG